jgi:AraC-like DNA-binding protein
MPSIEHSEVRNLNIQATAKHWCISDEKEVGDFLFATHLSSGLQPFLFHTHYYDIGILTEGEIEMEINGKYQFFSPDIFFINRPEVIVKNFNISDNNKGCFILFTKQFLDNINENIFTVKSYSFLSEGVDSAIELKNEDRDILHYLYRQIFDIYFRLSVKNDEFIARNLISILIYQTDNILFKYIDQSKVVVYEPERLALNFKKLAYENFMQHHTVSFYAEKLNVSTSHLYKIVKEQTGESPLSFINKLLIDEIRCRLCNSDQSISEIAYALNFNNIFTFSRFFKTHTNYSPRQFRHGVCLRP